MNTQVSSQQPTAKNAQSIDTHSTELVQADASLFQSVLTVAFGLAIIVAVGFLPMNVAHNAAHDTRHSLAFPCH